MPGGRALPFFGDEGNSFSAAGALSLVPETGTAGFLTGMGVAALAFDGPATFFAAAAVGTAVLLTAVLADVFVAALAVAAPVLASAVVRSEAGVAPHRPKTQPPTFFPRVGLGGARCSAAIPLSRVRPDVEVRDIATGRAAWAVVSLMTA